jgi:hypothetical protein
MSATISTKKRYLVGLSLQLFIVLFLLAIELSVLLRYTDSDYLFGIFKLFLQLFLCKVQCMAVDNIPFTSTWDHPGYFLWGRVAHLFSFCVVLLCLFTYLGPWCDVRYDFHKETSEKTRGSLKTGQSRETGNIGHTRLRQIKTQHDMCRTPLYANKHK